MIATPMLLKPVESATAGNPSVWRSVVSAGGACTVRTLLVASLVQLSLANSRTLYVPGVMGAVKCSVALETPIGGGVVDPFRYFHARYVVSGALAESRVTQSFGYPGPFATVTVTSLPGLTGVEGTVTVVACTVTGLLVASLDQPSFAKRRTL